MWIRSRGDRPKELPTVVERARTPRSLSGSAGKKATERPSATRETKKGGGKGKSKGLKKCDGKGAGKGKKGFKGKCFK